MAATTSPSLEDIVASIDAAERPPLSQWQPRQEADIDMRIAADGEWFYRGSRIGRERMVKLFASILRREGEHHFLVTPPVKYRIAVDDAPFVASVLQQHGEGGQQTLVLTTNIGEPVIVDAEHPLRVVQASADDEPRPYIRVRDELDALVSRSAFIDLAELAEQREGQLGVWSAGHFMVLGDA